MWPGNRQNDASQNGQIAPKSRWWACFPPKKRTLGSTTSFWGFYIFYTFGFTEKYSNPSFASHQNWLQSQPPRAPNSGQPHCTCKISELPPKGGLCIKFLREGRWWNPPTLTEWGQGSSTFSACWCVVSFFFCLPIHHHYHLLRTPFLSTVIICGVRT